MPSVAYGLYVTRRACKACSPHRSPIFTCFHQIVKLAISNLCKGSNLLLPIEVDRQLVLLPPTVRSVQLLPPLSACSWVCFTYQRELSCRFWKSDS